MSSTAGTLCLEFQTFVKNYLPFLPFTLEKILSKGIKKFTTILVLIISNHKINFLKKRIIFHLFIMEKTSRIFWTKS